VPPDRPGRRRPGTPGLPRARAGSGAAGADVPHPGRGGGDGRRRRVRPGRRGLERRRVPGARGRRPAAGRPRGGEHGPPARPRRPAGTPGTGRDSGTGGRRTLRSEATSPGPAATGAYRMFVGGRFTAARSGRTYRVGGATVPLAAGEDVDDAVAAARAAFAGWSGAAAYHRGRTLYRVAEALEARVAVFSAVGVGADELCLAVDRWVWYAGWADKVAQAYGRTHPVAGGDLTVSAPAPVGVVGAAAPADA